METSNIIVTKNAHVKAGKNISGVINEAKKQNKDSGVLSNGIKFIRRFRTLVLL